VKHDRNFKIGLFILSGIFLLAALLVALGAGSIFKDSFIVETYFDESVQGLDVGGAVKFRGVQVGTVKSISFVWAQYDTPSDQGRYVLVTMALDGALIEKFFGAKFNKEDSQEALDRAAANGLRARLTTQGLTGVAFLQLDFSEKGQFEQLPISWEPENPYIPSAPSTMSRLEAAFDSIGTGLKEIESVDFKGIGHSLNEILAKINEGLGETEGPSFGVLIKQNLTELHGTLARTHALLAKPEIDSMIEDASRTFASTRRITSSAEKDVSPLLHNLNLASVNMLKTSETLRKLLASDKVRASVDKLPEALTDIRNAARDIRRGTQELELTLRNMNDITSSEAGVIRGILEKTREVMENLNAITTDVKENPSRLFLGAPPSKLNPEKLP